MVISILINDYKLNFKLFLIIKFTINHVQK